MRKIYIYKIISPDGKLYIGQTSRFRDRLVEHTKARSPIGEALRKFGIMNFRIEVIWATTDSQLADHLEEAAIQLYDCKTPNGYNQTIGGQRGSRGYHVTEDAKRRMSEFHREWFRKHPEMKFKSHSEESKKKISEAMKLRGGHPQTQKTRDKISSTMKGRKLSLTPEEYLRRSSAVSGDRNPMRRRRSENATPQQS